MTSKFEQLIEYVINDDEAKAKELFHDIVVEKSREIYENLMNEESDAEEDNNAETATVLDRWTSGDIGSDHHQQQQQRQQHLLHRVQNWSRLSKCKKVL